MSYKQEIKNAIFRFIGSKRMTKWASLELRNKQRANAEAKRIKEGRSHEITYFHSVSDPYSYLVLQKLDNFINSYDVNFNFILVGDPPLLATPEPDMYKDYSLLDSIRIAPFYSTKPPAIDQLPTLQNIQNVQRLLTNTSKEDLINKALSLGHLLWQGNVSNLETLVKDQGHSIEQSENIIQSGNDLRHQLKHYLAAVFNYEGENYWGLDRLQHLERRLKDLNLKTSEKNFISKRTISNPKNLNHDNNFTLEFYPSLNSPYTYISFERVKALSKNYPVKLVVKPVLPMLMRGMKIPSTKGLYIVGDASREGLDVGVKFNKILTPIGKPAERAYSLFPWIDSKNKGFDYLHKLMISSFHDGKNIYKESYLQGLIEELDLEWEEAREHLDNNTWQTILEKNRLNMYEGSVWGVPGFKLVGPNDYSFSVWGQDRFWLLKKEIMNLTKR